jgi:hypothetical protein
MLSSCSFLFLNEFCLMCCDLSYVYNTINLEVRYISGEVLLKADVSVDLEDFGRRGVHLFVMLLYTKSKRNLKWC